MVEEAIAGIKSIYQNFFSILEQQKGRPDIALNNAEKYIINNRDQLVDYGRVIGGINRLQEPMIRQYRRDIDSMIREAGKTFGPGFASDPVIKTRLIRTMDSINRTIAMGVDDTDNVAIRAGGRIALAYMHEIILIDMYREKYSPIALREGLLDGWCRIMSRYGADREMQDALRIEIKENLGWR